MSGDPYPKDAQLARGVRRYRRKVASAKDWQRLHAEKDGPCRVCSCRPAAIHLHHVVTREDRGDDIADNLVPVCAPCHDALHRRVATICRLLLTRLSDAEYSYAVERGGEAYFERAYGLVYTR